MGLFWLVRIAEAKKTQDQIGSCEPKALIPCRKPKSNDNGEI